MRPGLIRLLCLVALAGRAEAQAPQTVDWPGVGNDPGCMRYSPLDQINRENVARLKPAWTYHTRRARGPHRQDDRMHADRRRRRDVRHHRISPRRGPRRRDRQGTLAVRPAQGPSVRAPAGVGRRQPGLRLLVRRQARRRAADHPRHVGRPPVLAGRRGPASSTRSSARAGIRDLREELDPKVAALALRADVRPGRLEGHDHRRGLVRRRARASPRRGTSGRSTSAPARRSGGSAPSPGRASSGTRRGRAIPGRTGAGRTPGAGSASTRIAAWSSPGSGSAAFDFYGGDRHGDNLFANCTIAPRRPDRQAGLALPDACATTSGTTTCRSIPNLVTVTRDGKPVDAVAQVTKTGYVFLFDRETGKPLFDVEDQPVPASDVPGERAAATQPIPVKPPPFSAQSLDETNVTDIGEANRASVLDRLRTDPGRPGLQPAEPARDGRHPRLPRRGELVGGVVRPDDRPALRQLEQRAEHHHAGRDQAGRQRRDTGPIGTRATSSSSTTRATRRSSRPGAS